MYYLCSENKGADQLCRYREDDLRLCFRICKNPVFSRRGSYKPWVFPGKIKKNLTDQIIRAFTKVCLSYFDKVYLVLLPNIMTVCVGGKLWKTLIMSHSIPIHVKANNMIGTASKDSEQPRPLPSLMSLPPRRSMRVHVPNTVKFLYFRTPEIFAVFYLKYKQRGQTLRVFHQNGANGIANIKNPDQSSLIWICTVCPDIFV